MRKKVPNESTNLAGRTFNPSDYQKDDTLSSALSTTHEQVSDVYMEGEISAVIDEADGSGIPLNRKQ